MNLIDQAAGEYRTEDENGDPTATDTDSAPEDSSADKEDPREEL
jgi:hypothetical protein